MILESEITLYKTCRDNTGSRGTFADYLRLGLMQKEAIEEARRIGTKEAISALKATLPCAAISGIFEPTRKTENLQKHSGLMCVDIDHVDPESIMPILKQIDCIAFASRSVSGRGVYAIVRIAHPTRQKKHYAAIVRDFAAMGIEVDKQCSDVTRLRFVSYDPDCFIRANAEVYTGLYEEPQERPSTPQRCYTRRSNDLDRTLARVHDCCRVIAQNHIDLTDNYEDWVKIGMSLASLGEEGRGFFDIVSRQCPKYNPGETDRKFTNLLQHTQRMSIGTFFKICNDNQINI